MTFQMPVYFLEIQKKTCIEYKFPIFLMILDKFPIFSLSGKLNIQISCFLCAVTINNVSLSS